MMNMNDTGLTAGKRQAFVWAWVIGTLFYFVEYAVRSSPAVMIPELERIFKVDAVGIGAIVVKYYFTYSVTSLVAGVALDRWGGKGVIATGSLILGIGSLLFAVPTVPAGDIGRLLQGAGSAFAFTGCVYLAAHGFSPKFLATAIGITQCLGMLGGSAGQFVTGPLISAGFPVSSFWIVIGIASVVIAVLLYLTTPKETVQLHLQGRRVSILAPYRIVFTNVQSYLSGVLSGFLFAPTTIFAMTWGVAFLKQDLHFSNQTAVVACAMVPLGWVVGCPLAGWISDRMGKRKPVLIVGIVIMFVAFAQFVYLPALLPCWLTLAVFGIASGVAMIPYSIIKEANPDEVKGSATGGINFLVFGVTSILGPVFAAYFGKTLFTASDSMGHFRHAGSFFIVVILLAFVLSLVIGETGGGTGLKKVKVS